VFRLVARASRGRVEYTLHAASPGPGLPGDAVVDLTRARIHMDPDTVRLIHGARLDFVPGSAGGFRLLPADPTP
jgi:Fe-S cluster assembly iron-binding protein IscA